ncbi:hypothetical protein ABL78_0865 [Leptomonas seymouri]|uniref:Uncharacterized protein n=1 Tax=Leptomonas seymouri TaxID=5684 RepID=A0A0N1I869_LEPSE|nr:hypothetical protein ABL78_0865 [Leptomonas seymouri]|eukprot:KPI90005.1 hypothetical protein ABL78_0865 [Leptomonas seymouri]
MEKADFRSNCVALLKLQRERSFTYQQWNTQFHRALVGDITPSELQRNIQGIILPEFQRVSTALRTLQASLAAQTGDGAVPNAAPASATENSVAGGKRDNQRNLAAWIDALQNLEREHYGVTLSLANQLVDHCTPNAVPAPPSAGEEEKKGTVPQGEVVVASILSLLKPDDSENEDRSNEVKGNACTSQPVADAAEKVSAATATLRVHDGGRCALQRLVPPRYQKHLFFVDCKEGVDELGGAPDSRAASCAPSNDSDEELLALPLYEKERGDGAAGNSERGPPIAFYEPSAISRRCVGWSRTVEPIVRRQHALRAAIEDMCEELQNDISDSAPPFHR